MNCGCPDPGVFGHTACSLDGWASLSHEPGLTAYTEYRWAARIRNWLGGSR